MSHPADSPGPGHTLDENVGPAFDTVGPVFRAAAVLTEQPAHAHAAIVRAVVPCFNRPADLESLLGDLDKLELATPDGEIRLDVVVIDNASDPPLRPVHAPGRVPVQIVRLPTNTGGSGGFNAGMSRLLSEPWGSEADPRREFLWLVDSDVRLRPETLVELVAAMNRRPDLVVAGATLADTQSGEIFEVGGRVNRRTGVYGPAQRQLNRGNSAEPIVCDYVAAACALVRRWAAERVGLMPDRFLNGDDVEWCIRLARETGGAVAVIPSAIAMHPHFDRFPTHLRFYGARSSMGPLAALGLRRRVRFLRGLVETARAVNQEMLGRADLAAMHLRGLRESLAGRTTGPAPRGAVQFEKFRPWPELPDALKEIQGERGPLRVAVAPGVLLPDAQRGVVEAALTVVSSTPVRIDREQTSIRSGPALRGLLGAALRPLVARRPHIAVIPAEGRATSWFAGRWVIAVVPDGFVVRRLHRIPTIKRAIGALGAGIGMAIRLGLRRGVVEPLPPAHEPVHLSLTSTIHAQLPTPHHSSSTAAPHPTPARHLTLTLVILSYNRRAALEETLRQAEAIGNESILLRGILVVDNASSDGTVEAVRQHFPKVELLALPRNLGVDAFNRGVAAARGDVVLILDDDARVEPATLAAAMDLLAQRPELAAVTFEPKHPKSGQSEWKFSSKAPAAGHDHWPVMGCANLVRRDDWMNVRGYEPAFFLYRNDTDLAQKLLGAGRGVHFNPTWHAWHDSPAAARKSRRWFRLATRNWVWLAKRHGHGPKKWFGAFAGWAWAHKLAGLSVPSHVAVLRGGVSGLFGKAPPLPSTVRSTGRDWSELLRLHF